MKVKINGVKFDYFVVNDITLTYNSIASTFAITVPFNSNSDIHKDLFKPLKYKEIIFYDDEKTILTGVILNHKFQASSDKTDIAISGYSKTGIINDCDIPLNNYPLQVKNKSIYEIAKTICDIYGLKLNTGSYIEYVTRTVTKRFQTLPSKFVQQKSPYFSPYLNDIIQPVEEVKNYQETTETITSQRIESTLPSPDEKAGDYLSKICANRNLVLSHTPDGELLIIKPNYNKQSIAVLTEQDPIIISIDLDVNGQAIHRTIGVITQNSESNEPTGQSTIVNNMLDSSSKRTSINIKQSGENKTSGDTAKQILANELKNIRINISIRDWTINGIIPMTGDILTITSPSVYLFNPTKLFINDISFNENENGRTASISLVLPETYTGDNIQNIFA